MLVLKSHVFDVYRFYNFSGVLNIMVFS